MDIALEVASELEGRGFIIIDKPEIQPQKRVRHSQLNTTIPRFVRKRRKAGLLHKVSVNIADKKQNDFKPHKKSSRLH